jgi:hypothetical protein
VNDNRLAAAIKLLGRSHEVSVQVEDYSDDQMLIALADENSKADVADSVKIDVVRIARERLIDNPAVCKQLSARRTPVAQQGREQGA